ncbi:hypothetical protein VSR83_33215 [Paraburkholderia unamae]|uniref:Uncharacterized protein n=1 Tax=Paraburkholderia unamae TaxID=219649 RepID=A0ACC6RT14_9BURK
MDSQRMAEAGAFVILGPQGDLVIARWLDSAPHDERRSCREHTRRGHR